jgi:hypothetical protein
MAEKIWIVQGQSGQYSDWHCWTLCAFRTEGAAKKYAELLGAEYRVFKTKWPGRGYNYSGKKAEQRALDLAKTLDPSGYDEWDGPNYTAYETELR